jgi:class 3 adenylate cyclase
MQPPAVQYVTTDDGVRVAYTVCGTGFPLVYMQPFSHQQMDWQIPEMRAWYEALAERHQLVRFDMRRFGMSERKDVANAPADIVRDLEAVVGRVDLGRFDLLGVSGLALVAILYAVNRPEVVRRLVLWGGSTSGLRLLGHRNPRISRALFDVDDEAVVELHSRVLFGRVVAEEDPRMTMTRATVSAKSLRGYIEGLEATDLSRALDGVRCPTLLVSPMSGGYASMDDLQELAVGIREAEVAHCKGGDYPYLGDDIEERIGLLDRFLGTQAREPAVRPVSGFRTILFTDLESSTALTQRVGDAAAQQIVRGHNEVVRSALAANGGTEVKHTGDGIMATFGSSVSAVEAALTIQRSLERGELRVRIGLNAGEPIAEDGDYFGSAVQLAARVCATAEPGQVVATQVVRDLCRGKAFTFDEIGSVTLKGFPEPERLFAVAFGPSEGARR